MLKIISNVIVKNNSRTTAILNLS